MPRRRPRPSPSRPYHHRRAGVGALAAALLAASGASPARAQGPEVPVRDFPAPPAVRLYRSTPMGLFGPPPGARVVPARITVRPPPAVLTGPADPLDLGPPPPHHTRNAVLVTGGISVAIFGTLLLLPEEITGWSVRDRSWNGIKDEWRDFKRHVTNPPVWDGDSWFFNYVGHPYVGMHTYLMERNYGMSPLRSFVFSTAASVFFEYGIEAWAEPPSLQDLLITSPVGSVLGELNWRFTRHLRRDGLTFWEKATITVVNPIHVLQHGWR